MFKSFWFYFFITPFLISIFALDSMFTHRSPNQPVFDNALEHCQNIDNNIVYSDRGTAQDLCIDEYMNAPWSVELVLKIFLSFGFIFIIPLLLHLKTLRKKMDV